LSEFLANPREICSLEFIQDWKERPRYARGDPDEEALQLRTNADSGFEAIVSNIKCSILGI
jgi:hypothetical protein